MTLSGRALTSNRQGFQERKKCLAAIYREWYEILAANLSSRPGLQLELGSGAGFIKSVIPEVITSDVMEGIGTDRILNALDVGSAFQQQLSNLLLINVFHHIPDSRAFLTAAQEALVPGGRLLMIEPWNNSWSRLCYRLVGHEPFDPAQIGWSFPSQDPLLDSNQAQAWIVFQRDRKLFATEFPCLSILAIQPLMPFAYLLSGGHSLEYGAPSRLIKACRSFERRVLDRPLGMFAHIVIERKQ